MAGTLKFKQADLKPVVEAAKAKGTGLLLVKDQGVYLMADGTGGPDVVLAFAEGCNPNVGEFDDWYDKSRSICGGDDFGEDIDLPFVEKVVGMGRDLKIKMTSRSMVLEA